MALQRKITKIQELEAHSSAVTCVALGQLNGRVLATGGADCLVNLWVLGQKTPLKSLPGLSSAAECVRFDPTEESVAAGSSSGALKIWDLEADKIKRNLTGHKTGVTALDFLSFDPNYVVSGSADCTIKIWDLRRKTCVVSYKGHQDTVREVLFSPHGKWITSGGIDGTIQVYQWQAGKLLKELVHAKAAVYCLAFHPKDLLLASSGQDGVVKFWDLETFEVVSSTEKDSSPVRCIRFQKDGSSLLAGCDDMLKVYGWEPAVCHDVVPVGWGRVADMAVAGNSSQLITASAGKTSVVTYLVDLTLIRNSDSDPVDPAESVTLAQSTPVYRTLPRKLKDAAAKKNPDKQAASRPPVRSQSRDPGSRSGKLSRDNSSDHPVKVEIFLPKKHLNRSPARERSPSSDSSSSPSRGRGRSVSPSRKHPKSLALRGHTNSETKVQMNRPLVKTSSGNKSLESDLSRLSLQRSHSEALPDTEMSNIPPKINVPYRRSFFPSGNPAQITSPSFVSDYESGSSISSSPSHYRAPVMPFFSAKPQYSQSGNDRYSHTSKDAFGDLSPENVYTGGNTLTKVNVSHRSVHLQLKDRLDCLRSIQQLAGTLDVKSIIDATVRFNDLSILVDVLNLFCLKPSLWSLDCCSLVLPHLQSLVSHKNEGYVLAATNTLKIFLKSFASLIKNTLEAGPGIGVDISREERVQKSRFCYSHLLLLRGFIEKDSRSLSQNLRKEFRQVKLLMQTIDN